MTNKYSNLSASLMTDPTIESDEFKKFLGMLARISDTSIAKLMRRAKVKKTHGSCFLEAKVKLMDFMAEVIRIAAECAAEAGRNIVTKEDVEAAVDKIGWKVYG